MKKINVVGLLMLAIALSAGIAAAATASATVTIKIEGMHCGNCAGSLKKKLKATAGVEEVRVSFEKKEAWIKYDDEKLNVAKLREIINSTGFKAVEDGNFD